MYCSKCNKTFPEGTTFCDTCGSRLEADRVSNPNPAPYQPVNAGPTYQANTGYQPYTPQPYPAPAQANANNQVSTGKWLGIFLINIIPIVGTIIYLIMLFVWAFGNCKYPSLKSFSKAMLILMLIGIILTIVAFVFYAPLISEIMENGLEFDFGY